MLKIFDFCKDVVDALTGYYGDGYRFVCHATCDSQDVSLYVYTVELEVKLTSDISITFPWKNTIQNVYDRWCIRKSPGWEKMWFDALIGLVEGEDIEEL